MFGHIQYSVLVFSQGLAFASCLSGSGMDQRLDSGGWGSGLAWRALSLRSLLHAQLPFCTGWGAPLSLWFHLRQASGPLGLPVCGLSH